MAKRKGKRRTTTTYPTIKGQGVSSWIKFIIPTWEEARDAITLIRVESRTMVKQQTDAEGILQTVPAGTFKPEEAETALVDMLWELAVSKFESWNWCDVDGKDLPALPQMNPGDLLQTELGVVLECVQDLFGIKDMEEEGKARR